MERVHGVGWAGGGEGGCQQEYEVAHHRESKINLRGEGRGEANPVEVPYG